MDMECGRVRPKSDILPQPDFPINFSSLKFEPHISYFSLCAVCLESLIEICSAVLKNLPLKNVKIKKKINVENAEFCVVFTISY